MSKSSSNRVRKGKMNAYSSVDVSGSVISMLPLIDDVFSSGYSTVSYTSSSAVLSGISITPLQDHRLASMSLGSANFEWYLLNLSSCRTFFMNSPNIGNAAFPPCPSAPVRKCMQGNSPPTQTPPTNLGVMPTYHASA